MSWGFAKSERNAWIERTIVDSEGRVIAEVQRRTPRAKSRAHAHLIVAARDMLAALVQVRADHDEGLYELEEHTLREVDFTIAKAKGES